MTDLSNAVINLSLPLTDLVKSREHLQSSLLKNAQTLLQSPFCTGVQHHLSALLNKFICTIKQKDTVTQIYT